MSPLNTTQSVPVYDNTKKNSTTDINIVPMEPKIIYQRSEMEQLRYASNTPLNIKDNPQLELVARINFMPQFAVNLMPNHVPTPDGRNAHVNRRHVPHANGHDFSSSNSRSMNRGMYKSNYIFGVLNFVIKSIFLFDCSQFFCFLGFIIVKLAKKKKKN